MLFHEKYINFENFHFFCGEYKVEYLENRKLTFDETYIEIIPQVRGIEWYHQIGNPENPCLTKILFSIFFIKN
jgi:hypothetical protein